MKKLLPLTVIIVALFSASSFAQLEIGASYELRDEDPQNGFGIRIQKGILEKLPVVNLGLRVHASYFSEENNISPENETYSYSRDLTNYDLGIAAIGGVSVGLIEPYVGVGIGTENYDRAISDATADPNNVIPQSGEENSMYWNVLAGAKVTIIPLLKPFVEYRYSAANLEKPELSDVSSKSGRIMFGVALSF